MSKQQENIDDIDNIVNMIDEFISSDGAHMNLSVDKNSDTSFSKYKSNDCLKNMPCSIPTFFDGASDE